MLLFFPKVPLQAGAPQSFDATYAPIFTSVTLAVFLDWSMLTDETFISRNAVWCPGVPILARTT